MSLLKGGNELFANLDEKLASSTKNVVLQQIEFMESTDADNEAVKIYSKYKPLNATYTLHQRNKEYKEAKQIQRQSSNETENAYLAPKVVLYPSEKIEMNWKEPKRIGPGFANLGNTCFLNSVLQVLTYTAPLVNFAISDGHRNSCVAVGFCMLCEFRNHLIRVAKHNHQNGPIRPMTIIQRLSSISKNFKFGRQEDAHEFLRYVIEAFRKSCLAGKKNLDRFSKETTAINQIFGGFFRSQVTCLSCKMPSNTFDPMMELNLDIKESNTVAEAMKRTVRTEKLDGDNKYSCERCKKKVVALKRGNIHIPPKILTLQLKRFDFQRLFGGKISKAIGFDETLDLSSFLSNKPEVPVLYKLYAVLVHSGFSCNSGHYYCYVKAANGAWYEMNDSRVSQVGLQTVLRAQAYLLFYSLTGSKTTKTSFKDVQHSVKQLNIHSASTNNKKNISAVKDIDLQLFKSASRIVPSVERDKVQFSISGKSKQKPVDKVKELSNSNEKSHLSTSNENLNLSNSNEKPRTLPIQSIKLPKIPQESSLEAIRKEYDSSESEENGPSAKGSNQICLQISHATDNDRSTKSQGKSEDLTKSEPLPKSSPLSPPKDNNMEAFHKRKVKMSNGIINNKSKFGRWMPVRSSSCSFTPRAVLCRSLSDSSSMENARPVPNMREMKRQFSMQVDPKTQSDKIDRTKTWNVEENDRLDPSYGPMTSLPQNSGPVIDHCRERTSSVTSETGSISTKTGEWDVHEKDLFDSSSAPFVQERHFAGWRVEDRTDKKNSNPENDEKFNEKSQKTISQQVVGTVEDNLYRRPYKRYDEISSGLPHDSEKSNKHGKKSRKRSKCEERTTMEKDLNITCKKSRRENSESPESHNTREKSRKNKKKKKNKKSKKHEKDRQVDNVKEGRRNSSKRETIKREEKDGRNSIKQLDRKEQSMERTVDLKDKENVENSEIKGMNEGPEEKRRKKDKKKKRRLNDEKSKYLSVRFSDGRDKQRNHFVNDDDGYDDDNGDSRYSSVKTPRKVSLSMHDTTTTQSDEGRHLVEPAFSKSAERQSTWKERNMNREERKTPLSKKSKHDIPVKEWDESPKVATSWNGSNNNTVLDSLLSKKSKVTTWDNEASQNIRHSVSGASKRSRDRWDDEYDQGKVKKTKKRHGRSTKYKDNPFQKLQNRRNIESDKR